MQRVGAALSHHVHVRAWVAPIAGVVERGLDLEFRKGVGIGDSHTHVEALYGAPGTRAGDGNSVHLKIVLVLQAAVDRAVPAAFAKPHGVAGIPYRARRHAN